MSNRRKKRTHKLFKKPPTYYINILVILFFLALLGVFAKVFIFDSITKKEEINKVVPKVIVKHIPPEDTHHKYEEKTKALEIEYVDEDSVKYPKDNVVKKENIETKKFSFFDDKIENADKKELPPTPLKEDKNKPLEKKPPDTSIKKEILPKKKESPEKELVQIKEKEKQPKKDKIASSKEEKASTVKYQGGTPRLVIIIDDVTTKTQLNKILSIGYPITMSFLPPTQMHKDSAKLAQDVKIYMVHLPLEATTRKAEESDTLHVGDDMNKIANRIKELKILYPKAIYYNNHTGSKFTEDDDSMDKLMQVMKNNNLLFVDSRTSSKSVVKKYANKYEERYISRNVFLDNTPNKEYIKSQLQKAIDIAKSTGNAIAIGHPYGATLEALKESKDMLNGIDIVMVDKI